MLHILHFDPFDLFSSPQDQQRVLAQCSVLDHKCTLAYSNKCTITTLAAFLTVIAKWLAVVMAFAPFYTVRTDIYVFKSCTV